MDSFLEFLIDELKWMVSTPFQNNLLKGEFADGF